MFVTFPKNNPKKRQNNKNRLFTFLNANWNQENQQNLFVERDKPKTLANLVLNAFSNLFENNKSSITFLLKDRTRWRTFATLINLATWN